MWLWIGFHIFIILLLALDLGFSRRRAIEPRVAVWLSLGWIGVALLFNGGVYFYFGAEKGAEFFTAYLVEKSLSIDNLFLFLLIFSSFRVPQNLQPYILFIGVLKAFIFRLGMILAGVYLISMFHWMTYLLGCVIILTGLKLMMQKVEKRPLRESWVIRWVRGRFPMTDEYVGKKWVVWKGGVRYFTPLILVYLAVEGSDLIFALDSIPAVLAVTRDPFIAYTSNVFAVLGLRTLYFLIAPWIDLFAYFNAGLGGVLGFVGVKMILSPFVAIPLLISLAVIVAILGVAVIYSIAKR